MHQQRLENKTSEAGQVKDERPFSRMALGEIAACPTKAEVCLTFETRTT